MLAAVFSSFQKSSLDTVSLSVGPARKQAKDGLALKYQLYGTQSNTFFPNELVISIHL
jgi:hypothetical protein